jgi:hypothetical protein
MSRTTAAPILRRVIAEHIEPKPEKLRMEVFFSKDRGCGTVACLAGHVCLDAGDTPDFGDRTFSSYVVRGNLVVGADVRASEILGISDRQSAILFYMPYWPAKFREAYLSAKVAGGRVRVLKRRVNHFIKTGE